MRNFSIELLKQSPSKALRACASLSQVRLWGMVTVWQGWEKRGRWCVAVGDESEDPVPGPGSCGSEALPSEAAPVT